MNQIDELTLNTKSKMLLQTHDEVCVEISYDEKEIAHEIKNIMENAYKHTYVKLTCSEEFSTKNFADKEKGYYPA